MKQKNLPKLLSITFGILVLLFLIGFYTFAWVGPSEAPPGGNPPPPLLLAPSAIQTDASSTPSIWINKTAVSNILELKAGGTARFIIGYDGNVGIGATPNEKLTVGGAINLGTTANFNAGTIRWTGTDFEGYTGTAWTSLTAPGGAITFLALTDTPGSYSGQAGKYLKVNAAANAVEFAGILAADLPSSIDAAKIGGGTVDNTEFSYLNGVTSAIQTQLNNKITIPAGSAQGDVLIRDAAGWTRLAAGTSGQYLKTQGAAANPVWADVTGGGGIGGSGTASQVAFFTATTTLSSDSNLYWDNTNKSLGIGATPVAGTRLYLTGASYGLQSYGTTAGGYFRDNDTYGYAYLGYGNYGISAYGTSTDPAGYFKNNMTNTAVRVADDDRGIDASASGIAVGGWGGTSGGYFQDSDGSGYAYVGVGNYGIQAFGNTIGGYFKDSDSSGCAYVGVGNYGIQALGNTMGGYFKDRDSGVITYAAYGSYGLYTTSSIYFNNALLPGGSAGTSGQVLTSQGAGVAPVWTAVSAANTSLSNLSSVAINTSLLPGASGIYNLGSSTLRFNSAYFGRTVDIANSGGYGINIANSGTSYSIYINQSNSANSSNAMIVFNAGSGRTFEWQQNNTANNNDMIYLYKAGGTGNYITASPANAYLSTGGVWTNASSREQKENLEEIDGAELIAKIKELPIYRYNYKAEPDDKKHISPVSEDFYSLFKVGDDKSISPEDMAGINMATIKNLIERVERLENQCNCK